MSSSRLSGTGRATKDRKERAGAAGGGFTRSGRAVTANGSLPADAPAPVRISGALHTLGHLEFVPAVRPDTAQAHCCDVVCASNDASTAGMMSSSYAHIGK